MGDEILMKKLLLLVGISSILCLSAKEIEVTDDRVALVQGYKNMFNSIGQKRVGASNTVIESVQPPFVDLNPEKKVEKKKIVKTGIKVAKTSIYELQAIVNNRVKISGKWYKLDDKVNSLTVVAIDNDSVFLQNNDDKKRLTLRKKNANITIN